MKFTLNWLKQYIDSGLNATELADRLTMAGLEVDSVEALCPDLDGVRVARVASVAPHPNADKLTLCQVEVEGEPRQVVCGAPNVRAGMLTAIALPGTTMPGGFKIKPAKLRGEKSEGMLCSARELGIGGEEGGIMDLPADLEIGAPLVAALDLEDVLVEVDLTPNRPDCASVLGLAREVGGFVGKRMTPPVAGPLPRLTGEGLPFTVTVTDTDCRRYAARLIEGVSIGPSPWWLKQLLLAVGLRPINNVVDVTNLVMLEYGQPLHAFDFARLSGAAIVVRKARPGETMATLDGATRELDSEMLMICDAERPVAVAGVMGGEGSQVTDATTSILLESAYFEPVSIRRTARRLNLSTDSSYRFERGVDPEGIPYALERAARLIVELAGGRLMDNGYDVVGELPGRASLDLRVRRTNELLGLAFSADRIAALLNSIEIATAKMDEETLRVTVPSFRVDLEREVDLVEEVARLHGYNAIPTALPAVPMRFAHRDAGRSLRQQVAAVLTGFGFHEAINYSFTSPAHCDLLGLAADDPARQLVPLVNPLVEDQSVMRSLLLPGLLENLRRNINHQQPDVRLFEVGKVFRHRDHATQPEEMMLLGCVMSGRRHPGASRLHYGEALVDLLDVRGVAEALFGELRLADRLILAADAVLPSYVAAGTGLALAVGATPVGWLGQVAPSVAKAFGIKQDAFYLSLNLDALAACEAAPKRFASLPKFPAVQWDLALVVADGVGGGDLLAAITEAGEQLIERAEIFDIYRGKNIAAGHKSVAIAITYRAEDRTLDDDTVGKVHERIIGLLESRFDAHLREA